MAEKLDGGREGITRNGLTVTRPSGPWSPHVHALLRHIRDNGFLQAPEPMGFDPEGREIVSFLPGNVSNYPLSQAARSDTALVSAARLMRAYHDATAGFAGLHDDSMIWMLPVRHPRDVMCHADFAPYNVVLQGETAVGIIDFDTAHPGPRHWDLAYALYRWSAFHHPQTDGVFNTIGDQIRRARQFCLAYGFDAIHPQAFSEDMIARITAMIDFMTAEADAGNETFQANIRDGHLAVYQRDRDHIASHASKIDTGIFGS